MKTIKIRVQVKPVIETKEEEKTNKQYLVERNAEIKNTKMGKIGVKSDKLEKTDEIKKTQSYIVNNNSNKLDNSNNLSLDDKILNQLDSEEDLKKLIKN